MATAAKIDIKLDMQAGQFNATIESAQSSMAGVATGITALNQGVELAGKVWRGFVRVLRLAGEAFNFINDQAANLDQIAKDARRTGVAGESLFIWQKAAEAAGASTESLTKSVIEFNTRLGEAKLTQSGAAKRALDALGLDPEALTNPEVAFRKALDEISRKARQDPQLAAVIGRDLFGRGFRDLLPLIEKGSVAFDEMGQALGDFDFDFGAAEAYSDQLLLLRTQWDIAKMQIVSDLLPAGFVFVEMLAAMSKQIRENTDQIIAFTKASAAVFGVGASFVAFEESFKIITERAKERLAELETSRPPPLPELPEIAEREERERQARVPRFAGVTTERGAFARIRELRAGERLEERQVKASEDAVAFLRAIKEQLEQAEPVTVRQM